MKDNPIREKSYAFALRIVKMCKWLASIMGEKILMRQILRSGTSIGANVEEAVGSYSAREFASKMQIAYKESLETRYWLRLLHDSGTLDDKTFGSISSDCEEIVKLLSSITKTLRTKGEPDHAREEGLTNFTGDESPSPELDVNS